MSACQSLEQQTDALMAELATVLQAVYRHLDQRGYQFDSPEYTEWVPESRCEAMLAGLAAEFGPLPYVLQSFYRHIGSVCFCGEAPWLDEFDLPDPLQWFPLSYLHDDCLAEYHDDPEYREFHEQRLAAYIAADLYHKEDISGGAPYTLYLPQQGANPVIELTPYGEQISMLDYLALALEYYLFPGCESPDDAAIYLQDAALRAQCRQLGQHCRALAMRYAEQANQPQPG
ncbi:hypothetical protein [Chitinilyticum piscinae]|uniref:Uncharacterized protein n=1 Tax=Chitinilyticum piscinae TaxID=2866724 RepID=A0A8J7FFK0_9NEIS|nr:hypothetical protein [Chitinilyticum piscinae]MBE9608080.1 hypothetical protein [Chitinilyticum piscinae]